MGLMSMPKYSAVYISPIDETLPGDTCLCKVEGVVGDKQGKVYNSLLQPIVGIIKKGR